MSYAKLMGKEPEAPTVKFQPARGPVAGGLHISASNDACEHEADRVADAALSGRRSASLLLSKVGVGTVQRQPNAAAAGKQTTLQPNNYSEAEGKLAEAFLKTDIGKKLTDAAKSDPLAKGLQDFIGTLPGKIITGAAAAGAVSAMAATHTALPAQIPDIPLESLRPGLSVHITYGGAVDHPTRAGITFSYTPKGDDEKPKQTESERYRAETARMAADQERFRAGMKYAPGSPEDLQQKAEKKAVEDYTSQRLGALAVMGGRPLAPSPAASEGSADVGLQLPSFQSPLQPRPFHLLDRHLELKPLTPSSAPRTPKKTEQGVTIQRKADSSAQGASVPAGIHEVLRSSGTPLDRDTRRLIESRIGVNFGNVRVHTDARAAASARALNAKAYTVGRDVVFASGQYSPHSPNGQKLLAHELAHTIQQNSYCLDRDMAAHGGSAGEQAGEETAQGFWQTADVRTTPSS